MRRRSVVIGELAALLVEPERSTAQQPQSKISRVGMLSVADSDRAVHAPSDHWLAVWSPTRRTTNT
jgi:hypothetical protein